MPVVTCKTDFNVSTGRLLTATPHIAGAPPEDYYSATKMSNPLAEPRQRPTMSVRVLAETNEGGRQHMEDVTCCVFDRSRQGGQAFLAVFDGHGGKHAAVYARAHLWDNIKAQKGFDSDNHELVKNAIREGFAATQKGMESAVDSWPRSRFGLPSTAGTTASAVILRGRTMYIAHVGDSGIVLAQSKSDQLDNPQPLSELDPYCLDAIPLTVEHKPDSPAERERIQSRGGEVREGTRGVPRVVWRRVRQASGVTASERQTRSSTDSVIDCIPFLGVSRALGDLWSWNAERSVYVVSPEPDVSHRSVSVGRDRFLVIASDGVWNVMSMSEVVAAVVRFHQQQPTQEDGESDSKDSDDVCHSVLTHALQRWRDRRQRADNVSLIVVFLEPPEPISNGKLNDTTESAASSVSTDVSRCSSTPAVSSPDEPEASTPSGPTALARQSAIHEPGDGGPPAKLRCPPLQEDLVSSSSDSSGEESRCKS